MLKTLLGIGSGQPSYSSSYLATDAYKGLMQEIGKYNLYNVTEEKPMNTYIPCVDLDAESIGRRFYDTEDCPSHIGSTPERMAEWLIEAINVPNKLGWPVKPVLPMRNKVDGHFVLNFDTMIDINMEAKVMSIDEHTIQRFMKRAVMFKDAEDTSYRFMLVATKQLFTDRLVPFTYYHKYMTGYDNSLVEVWIAPKDLSPQIDGWQIHVHKTKESIKQTPIKSYTI